MKQFGIFAKYWTAGRVKTRLAASVGESAATDFHRVCVETLLKRFRETGDRQVIGYAPSERETEFQAVAGESWTAVPQVAGNLGERMAAYFGEAFDAGMTRVLLIGSDSPTMPTRVIDDAFEALKSNAVVLGPTDDGGYYLIGMSNYRPEIFDDIEWGTEQVWKQTVDRLAVLGILSWTELMPWYDVDRVADLNRLASELATEADPVFEGLKQVVNDAMTRR